MTESMNSASREAAVVRTFDDAASSYLRRYDPGTTAGHSFNVRRRRVYELLPHAPGARLLDVGCGPGVMVGDLVTRGFDLYGVDISERMIEECRSRFPQLDAGRFSVGRVQDLRFPSESFDVVLCVGVVEYLEDDGEAIREMARVLKPGGVAIITLPNRRSPFVTWNRLVYKPLVRLLQRIRGRTPPPEVTHREYTESAYGRLLGQNGLRAIDIVYYNFKLVPSPLDRLLPRWTIWTSSGLEFLRAGPLRWLGTGFIVKAGRA